MGKQRGTCEILMRFAELRVDTVNNCNLPQAVRNHPMILGIMQHLTIYRTFPNRYGGGRRKGTKHQADTDSALLENRSKARKIVPLVTPSPVSKEGLVLEETEARADMSE